MKNKEKNASKIVDIACNGHDFMVDKNTNEVADCCSTPCITCLFSETDDCDEARRQWAESEYIEKPVISKVDRAFLKYLREHSKWMTRDADGNVAIWANKPEKREDVKIWIGYISSRLNMFNIDFPMVKWSDSEPWLIEDLKKLEVVETYE